MDQIKEKTREHFNETAKYYDESFDGKYVQPMYQVLLEEIAKYHNGKLLDVGCGNGNVLKELEHSSLELYGIDLSEQMIKQAEIRLNDNVKLYVADAEETLFLNDYFDLMVCNASFHHYPHPGAVLKEMHRIIKKGGVLLIGEGYAIQPFRYLLNVSFKYSTSGDFHSYGKRELIKLLRNNGFQLMKIRKTGSGKKLYIARAV